ncbi:hypothetical protein [Salinisphaera sp. T31B1]|uniref:hypothetical protein n=1 Tax=Salinisphaera sp. T31B1 TaxID=727963 RepID=UPI00334179DC
MKPQIKSYLIVACLGALMLAGCATGPTSEPAQTSAANRVLEAYDVPDLLAQAAPAVSQSLDKNLPDDVPTAERQRLRDAVYAAYAPDALAADVTQRLREQAKTDGRERALASAADELASPLAQRMISLESATGDDGFAQGFSAFVEQPATDARKRRLRIIDSLSDDMQIVQLQTAFNVTLLEAMIRGRNAVVDSDRQVDEPQIERMLSNTRDGIRGKLDERVPLMLLYVYRDVDDATLQDYADLQSQPDMVWTNQAVEKAIIDALAAAGDQVPTIYNQGA